MIIYSDPSYVLLGEDDLKILLPRLTDIDEKGIKELLKAYEITLCFKSREKRKKLKDIAKSVRIK